MEESFITQKFKELFKKHSADGTTPRKLIESNMSREMRFSKDEIHKILENMHLEQEEAKKRRLKRIQPQYTEKNNETYQAELRSQR
jgi:hypothetical protein